MIGDDCEDDTDNKNLGLRWQVRDDTWKVSADINLSGRQSGVKNPEKNIDTVEQARVLFEAGVNKKVLCRIVHCLYDPLNMFINVHTNLELLFRKFLINNTGIGWNDTVKSFDCEDWLAVIQQILECREIKIDRFVLRGTVKMECQLIVMVDGSSLASAFWCFVRFQTEDGIKVNYLMGGSKLAGVGGNTAAKCEVESALMGVRAIASIHSTMKNISFTENILISDSLICLGGLCR